jgi:deoxyguanosine kinase
MEAAQYPGDADQILAVFSLETSYTAAPMGELSRPATTRAITVEGLIGSGKTTLAKAIAHELGCPAILEDYRDIPSLTAFYADPETFAYQTEIEFTVAHATRLHNACLHGDPMLVTDFSLKRDRMFAEITLASQPNKLVSYRSVWEQLATCLPTPRYVLVLQAPLDTVMGRIEKRQRPFERNLKRSYLERLASGFEDIYRGSSEETIEFLDATDLDRLLEEVSSIAGRIRAALG